MLNPNAFPYTFTEHHKEIDTDRCRYPPEAEPKWSKEVSPEAPHPSNTNKTGKIHTQACLKSASKVSPFARGGECHQRHSAAV